MGIERKLEQKSKETDDYIQKVNYDCLGNCIGKLYMCREVFSSTGLDGLKAVKLYLIV